MAFTGLAQVTALRRGLSLLRVGVMLLVAVAMPMALGDKVLHQPQMRQIAPLHQLNLAQTPPPYIHTLVDSTTPSPSSFFPGRLATTSIQITTYHPPDSIVTPTCLSPPPPLVYSAVTNKWPCQAKSYFPFLVCCSINLETWPCCEICSPAFSWVGLLDRASHGFGCCVPDTREPYLVAITPVHLGWVRMELQSDTKIGMGLQICQALQPATMVYIQVHKKYHTNFLSSASIGDCCSFVWVARLWLGPMSSSPCYDDGCQVLFCSSLVKLLTYPRLNIIQPQVFNTQVRPLQNLSSMQNHVSKLLFGFTLLASSPWCGFHIAVRGLFVVAVLLHPCNRNTIFRPLYSDYHV